MPRLSCRMLLAPLAAAMLVDTGPSPAAAASEARARGKAVEVAYGYLASLSTDPRGPGGAPPYAYGVEVGSDGGPAPGADFLADRRALARRWPIRHYSHRPGSMRVSCNMPARKCAVRSIVDYRLADPGRRISVAGATRLDLGIGFGGPAPRILYEEGRLEPVARR